MKALITGITGQDGSHLADHLLQLGYEVYGMHRRASTSPSNFINIEHIKDKIKLIHGELTDEESIERVIKDTMPDELYNLGAQSHVQISEREPKHTRRVNAKGVFLLLETLKEYSPKTKFYQASTSEMFGNSPPPQNETTPFDPRSPYAEAKVFAHKMVQLYREQGMFALAGILFNHEGPHRGELFVSRKITSSLAKIKLGKMDKFEMGNLDGKRDWGYAGDYVKAMHLMLQQQKPTDYVVSTGVAHTVREFIQATANALDMDIKFEGEGLEEKALWNGRTILTINPAYFRQNEVNYLCGDSTKARNELGWKPETTFEQLVEMMAKADLELYSKHN